MELAAALRKLRPQLIDQAVRRLARGEGLRHTVESEVARFYDLLIESVETGSADWLYPLLKEWVDDRSLPAGDERATLLPVLLAYKTTVWALLPDALGAEASLGAMESLEHYFADAGHHLVGLEMNAAVADVRAQISSIQDNLQRLDESKSRFIAVAAHELKTPLTLIEGYANMLTSWFTNEQRSRAATLLGGIANGTRRLREIVDDMIDVSMIDNNLLMLNFQPVWLRRMFEIAEGELGDRLAARRQRLVIDEFEDGGRPTFADPERLYQVFMNLLANAIKYTPDGGVITVRARPLPGFVHVSIQDTGIGIDPANQQSIFEKFGGLGDVALHSSGKVKFKGGGPGLGLAIARGIIEAHGGSIWCESPGYDEAACPGSTFHIMVPMREAPPEDRSSKLFGLTDEEVEKMGLGKR